MNGYSRPQPSPALNPTSRGPQKRYLPLRPRADPKPAAFFFAFAFFLGAAFALFFAAINIPPKSLKNLSAEQILLLTKQSFLTIIFFSHSVKENLQKTFKIFFPNNYF